MQIEVSIVIVARPQRGNQVNQRVYLYYVYVWQGEYERKVTGGYHGTCTLQAGKMHCLRNMRPANISIAQGRG